MGLIKLDDKVVSDRRTNGARLRLDIADWLKVFSVVVILILAFGNLKWTVEAHSKNIETNTGLIKENCRDIAVLQNSYKEIDRRLSSIENKIDKLIMK